MSIPEGLDSRSLVELLEGNEEYWVDETVSQWGGRNLMIKWGSIKYQLYTEDDSEVIFDLEVDRKENTNLINEVQYAELLNKFRERAKVLGFKKKGV